MATEKTFDETTALRLLAQGNEVAFVQLYDEHHYHLYMTALRMLKSAEQAEEVTQEVFMRVWIRRETMTSVQNFGAYTFTILRNLVYSKYLERQVVADALKEYVRSLEPVNSTERMIDQAELDRLVKEFIDELPVMQKTIFTMAREENLSHEAIASQLDLTAVAVKSHMKRALSSLRAKLKPHLGTSVIIILALLSILSSIFPRS